MMAEHLLDGNIGGLLAGGLAGLGGVGELGVDIAVNSLVDLSPSVRTRSENQRGGVHT